MASIEDRLFWSLPAEQPVTRAEIVAALAPEVRAIVADELEALADVSGPPPRRGDLRNRATALRSEHS